jgi:REP element-mobilizing transposase RayT
MPQDPLAYHITFGTYGTHLHGNPRGSVDRLHNVPGEPIIGTNAGWERMEASKLRFAPRYLNNDQRGFVEAMVPEICVRGGWDYHNAAAQPDHVHSLLSTDSDGQVVRRLLKRWLGDALSPRWPTQAGESWWSEGGSVKWVWTADYFNRVIEYIGRQRFTR